MTSKRVVVTGLGALTPLGNSLPEFWEGLVIGKSGAAPISYFDTSEFKTKFACELKNYDPLNYFDRKEARKQDKFCQYAMIASDEAIIDSNINLEKINLDRSGVIWGAGIGGLETFQNEIINFTENKKIPKFNPFFIPKMISDIAPGMISIKYGFRGPNFTTVSACASSSNAIIDALNYIRMDFADIILTGI
jgi:3-oxoacyl-[acyl-carrier-protein] synthase II